MMAKNCLLKIQIFQGLFFLFDYFSLVFCSYFSIFPVYSYFVKSTQVKLDYPDQDPIFNPDECYHYLHSFYISV